MYIYYTSLYVIYSMVQYMVWYGMVYGVWHMYGMIAHMYVMCVRVWQAKLDKSLSRLACDG